MSTNTTSRGVTRIQTLYDDAIEVTANIRPDELAAINAVRAESIRDLKATTATAIAGAKALFASCVLAANALPYPASATATTKCIGWHAVKMAGIIAGYNSKKNDIENDWEREKALIDAEAQNRYNHIERRKEASLEIEEERNKSQLELIKTDLALCLARVNGN